MEVSGKDRTHILELAAKYGRVAEVIELRFFGGLTNREAADLLGVSQTTVEGDWRVGRAWLRRALGEADPTV